MSWGEVEVAGLGTFRDVKLWPGGGRAWDWTETGTHHDPGVLAADVAELLVAGVETIVVGRGMHGRLGVSAEAREMLDEAGVALHALLTTEAADFYGRLAGEGSAGLLLHTTC